MKTFYVLYEDKNGSRCETTVEHWTRDEAMERFYVEHPLCRVIEFSEEK